MIASTPPELMPEAQISLVGEIAARLNGAGHQPAALTYAIGDIHGHATALMTMLGLIADDAKERSVRLVVLGDTIDMGPASARVIEILRHLESFLKEGSLVALRGNHEEQMLAAIHGGDTANSWLGESKRGGATLASYGIEACPGALEAIPASHVAWLKALRYSFEDDDCYYVHAGLRPGVAFAEQSPYDLIYIKAPFLTSEHKFARHVIHGHSPVEGFAERHRYRTNADTGCGSERRLTAVVVPHGAGRPMRFLSVATDQSRPIRGGWARAPVGLPDHK